MSDTVASSTSRRAGRADRIAPASVESTSVTPLFLEPTPLADTPVEPAVPAVPSVPTPEPASEPSDAARAASNAPLLQLRDGVPAVIDDETALEAAAHRLRNGHGPLAVDAERASSYRYGHRAYLVQIRREGAGTLLIDPISCPDLRVIGDAVAGVEWVLHAANQDLACLGELGLHPPRLFDTELAARLAGYPRVGLATMVELLLGWRIEKDHSAADWSRRPLPEPWLRYAALDVEVLLELRQALEAELARQRKATWAEQEFEHVRAMPTTAASVERWRRVSGIHRIRNRRQLAVVRSMWLARDQLAREQDVSPGRLLPDASIVHVATAMPANAGELAASPDFQGRGSRRYLSEWWRAISDARALAEDELPESARPTEGPPPAHRWAERDRAAAARLAAAKAVVAALADERSLPAENLLQPDAVRRLAWRPPDPTTKTTVAAALHSYSARPWQTDVTAGPLAKALLRAAAHETSALAAGGAASQ